MDPKVERLFFWPEWYLSWPMIIMTLIFLPPIGLILLLVRAGRDRSLQFAMGGCMSYAGVAVSALVLLMVLAAMMSGEFGCSLFLLIALATAVGVTVLGFKYSKRAGMARQYIKLIVNEGHASIDSIASILKQDIGSVMQEVQELIEGGYLSGYVLDPGTRQLSRMAPIGLVGAATDSIVTFQCGACGANNQAVGGGLVACEYCGSPKS